ncbi:hypothetical protein [Cellulomonas persica]|nr:hypothetical protein [Cellulomonas persica]
MTARRERRVPVAIVGAAVVAMDLVVGLAAGVATAGESRGALVVRH